MAPRKEGGESLMSSALGESVSRETLCWAGTLELL